MALKIAVCDDEAKVREWLAEKIRKYYPKARLVCYAEGEELLQEEKEGLPDILFLDIQMPRQNGMQVAKQLRIHSEQMIIIFVTAMSDYIFEAFDVGAFHYLVKPFTEDKLQEVLQNAIAQYEKRIKIAAEKGIEKTPDLLVKSKGKHMVVNLEEIIYAEVFDRKIMLHTLKGDIEYYGRMKELEQKAGINFFRSHRAYLVNFKYVQSYNAETISMERGMALMAKKSYPEFVKQYLHYHKRRGKA